MNGTSLNSSKEIPPLLTVDAVARRLQCTDRTIRNLVRRGQLPAVKIGAMIRFDSKDVELFINASKSGTEVRQ